MASALKEQALDEDSIAELDTLFLMGQRMQQLSLQQQLNQAQQQLQRVENKLIQLRFEEAYLVEFFDIKEEGIEEWQDRLVEQLLKQLPAKKMEEEEKERNNNNNTANDTSNHSTENGDRNEDGDGDGDNGDRRIKDEPQLWKEMEEEVLRDKKLELGEQREAFEKAKWFVEEKRK